MRWENNRRSSNIEDRRGESHNFGGNSRGSSIVSLLPLIKSLLGKNWKSYFSYWFSFIFWIWNKSIIIY